MANIIIKLRRQVNRPYVKKYDLQQLQIEDVKADFAIKVKQFLNSKEKVGAEQLAEVLNAAVTKVIPKVKILRKIDSCRNAATCERKATYKMKTK